MQSTLGAAFTVSWQRFVGTAIGAAAGALLATYFGSNMVIFAVGIFILGIICAASGLDRAAYRFAGITLAITMLIAHPAPAWIIAVHRFIEVSLGIAVGLAMTAIWPERLPDPDASFRWFPHTKFDETSYCVGTLRGQCERAELWTIFRRPVHLTRTWFVIIYGR